MYMLVTFLSYLALYLLGALSLLVLQSYYKHLSFADPRQVFPPKPTKPPPREQPTVSTPTTNSIPTPKETTPPSSSSNNISSSSGQSNETSEVQSLKAELAALRERLRNLEAKRNEETPNPVQAETDSRVKKRDSSEPPPLVTSQSMPSLVDQQVIKQEPSPPVNVRPSSFGAGQMIIPDTRKMGWLEIRALKKFSKRFFLLHSSWLTYFKDEKMKKSECYGHVRLWATCTISVKRNTPNVFIIRNQSKSSVFVSRGPFGLSAATSHRMFHGKSAKCVLRCESPETMKEWVEILAKSCTAQEQSRLSLTDSQSSIGLGLSGSGLESSSEIETVDDDSFQALSSSTTDDQKLRRNFPPPLFPAASAGSILSRRSPTSATPQVSSNGSPKMARHREIEDKEDKDKDKAKEENNGKDKEEKGEDREDKRIDKEDKGKEKETEEEKEKELTPNATEGGEEKEPEEFVYNWPDNEKAAVMALKEALGSLYKENKCTEHMLWRFLKARAFSIPATVDMLNEYWKWKQEYKPEQIQAEEVQAQIDKMICNFIGYDYHNRPVLLINPGKYDPKSGTVDQFMRFICYIIETAIRKMPPPVQTFSCIVDLKDFGMSNMDQNLAREAAHKLQSFYPERLGVVVCINSPFVINVVWKVLKGLLDDRTKAKINFLKGTKDLIREGVFPMDILPVEYGGTSNFVCPPGSLGVESLVPRVY